MLKVTRKASRYLISVFFWSVSEPMWSEGVLGWHEAEDRSAKFNFHFGVCFLLVWHFLFCFFLLLFLVFTSSSISLPHAGTLPRFPTVPAPLSSLPTGINPPSSPRGITMPNLFNLPSMTIPSLPRGLSLPRPVAMAAVYEATRRLLQDCCSVLDHQAPGGKHSPGADAGLTLKMAQFVFFFSVFYFLSLFVFYVCFFKTTV